MEKADSDDAATDAEDEYLQEIAYVIPDIDDTTCGICHAEFLDPEDLDVHCKQVHRESLKPPKKACDNPTSTPSKVCQFCDVTYEDFDAYALHIRDEHLMQLFRCRVCTKCFTAAGPWKRHERKHKNRSNTFACSQCTAVFSTAKEVEAHEVVHHDNSYDGVFLDFLPHLSALMKQNIATHLQSDERSLTCAVCKFTTEDLDSYIEHPQDNCVVHTCNVCCYTTASRKSMIKHIRRKNKCVLPKDSECEFTVCTNCKTEVHCRQMHAHLISCKKFKCYICDIRFLSIESLSAHQTEAHPVELDVLKCRFCSKEFVGQISLDKHMKRSHSHHYGLYKYKCATCESIFKHPQLLFAHYFTKHKELEPYTCKICDKKFRVRKSFTIHIKMVHKSVGVVEFDEQYQVFFAENKSENPFIPQCVIPELIQAESSRPSIKVKTQKQINAEASQNDEDYVPTETEVDDEIEAENSKQKPPVKRKKREAINVSSSEEEEAKPLSMIKKRAERKRFQQLFSPGSKKLKRVSNQRRQLTCKACNKYCYTYQNYNNHIQSHKKENIKCIKCSNSFKSKNKLSEHMRKDHATSRLTETLKHVLERKQIGSSFHDNDSHDDRNDEDLTPSERFMKTIKKVKPDRQTVSATITPATGDVSVRKFIENFVPDIGDPNAEPTEKYDEEEPVVTLTYYDSPFYRKNLIKMTRFIPEPPQTTCQLKMPEKFKAPPTEKVKLRVKLVQEAPRMTIFEQYDEYESFNQKLSYEDEPHNDENAFVDNDDYEDRNEVVIPEVAEEVMLEGSEEPPKPNIQVPHKIVIPKLPEGYPKIHIATLQTQAPFYKIITVKNAENNNEAIVIDADNIQVEQTKQPVKTKGVISLPDGSKFVTANPLAHLLGGKPVEELLESTKNKYYKPAVKNFQGMFAEALQNLEKAPKQKRQWKKPKNDGTESKKRKPDSGGIKRKKIDAKSAEEDEKTAETEDVDGDQRKTQIQDTSEIVKKKLIIKPGKSLPMI